MGKVNNKVMLISGATGFLGQRVVLSALKRGHMVKAVVRPSRDISKMLWADHERVEIVELDLESGG